MKIIPLYPRVIYMKSLNMRVWKLVLDKNKEGIWKLYDDKSRLCQNIFTTKEVNFHLCNGWSRTTKSEYENNTQY